MSIKQSTSAQIYLSRYYTSSSLCENITPDTYESVSPLDNDMVEVYFPMSQVLNRRLDLLSQLSIETDPNRRAMLMNALQRIPSSSQDLSDDELLSLLKNRTIDSPTELEDYVNSVSSNSLSQSDSNSSIMNTIEQPEYSVDVDNQTSNTD